MTGERRSAGRRDPAARPSSAFSTDDGTEHGLDVRIVRGSPTPEEIAAVTAVLSAAVVEEAGKTPEVASTPSAWQRSQRTLRSPLTPGPGRWR
ncbi:acyl-CoA carboxylase subunit epsilon [Mycetocola zhadangensis]|uniref:acyl-CoA carboxylase subunit epsilon n=1 Tax=Mycetocola zhadangensis TaxID=1164595 RepID=UPI003A4E02A1